MAPRVKQRWQWGIGAVLLVWLLIVLAVAWIAPGNTVVGAPYIATFLTLGLLASTLPLLISPAFRQLVRAIPATGLIGIHAIRVLGILFLALLNMRLLLAVILAIFKPDWRVRRNTTDRRNLRNHLLDERALRL